MPGVVEETREARVLMDRVETLASVVASLPVQDERRSRLLGVIRADLESAAPLRPRIAAELLGVSEKTVRAWLAEGVLVRAEDVASPRVLLDVARFHQVLRLVRDLRAAGRASGLLDEVHRRLVDSTWLEDTDLAESLEQMRRGEGVLRVTPPTD
jgi:hypothetical protein